MVSEEKANKLSANLARPGDVIFTQRGANHFRQIAIIPKDGEARYLVSQSQMKLTVNRDIVDELFVYYCFISPKQQEYLQTHAISTGVPHTNLGILKSVPIPLPPLAEQKAIAAVLGALDDKIELNRRMSATLEEMARALLRSWFVDFDPVHAKARGEEPAHMDAATAALFPDGFGEDGLPEGWRPGVLGDVAIAPRTGVDPNTVDPETPYIGLEHMPRRSITLTEWAVAGGVGSQKSAMRAGDFLFGKLRPYFHKVGVAPVDGVCSTEIVVVRAKHDDWSGYVLSVISSDAFVEHTNGSSAGTRMPRTNWRDMAAFEVALPSVDVAKAFETTVGPSRKLIVAKSHELRTLAALRDSLLPKLMSGDLRVRDAERHVAEAV